MSTPKIRVLIVDDSAVVRQTLRDVLESDPEIEVIATAGSPLSPPIESRAGAGRDHPGYRDAAHGRPYLPQKAHEQHPIPVVICSSLAEEGAQSTFRALEYGGGGDCHQAAAGHQAVS